MENIFVTRPFLPPLEEFTEMLQQVWQSKHVTNKGPFHEQLETQLADFLGVPYISLTANGTLALLCALKAQNLKGEVITTPYTFVATTHVLKWLNLTPVFVDIEPTYCNLDPAKIEAAITPKTTAILPVHVYGNPCATEEIEAIAQKNGLKVIYDAAHAFNVKQNGSSILNAGDASIISMHATKIFHSFEGGAVISKDPEIKRIIHDFRNFGFKNEITIDGHGINAKMNEVQAAMGLLQLKYIEQTIDAYKERFLYYKKCLSDVPGITMITPQNTVDWNYSYFPVFVHESSYGKSRDALYDHLKKMGAHSRRYFYPLTSNVDAYKNIPSSHPDNLPVANEKANNVICLPLYAELEKQAVNDICTLIREFGNNP